MSTKPYSFEPMSVDQAMTQARQQARELNAGRYCSVSDDEGEEVELPAHLMIEDTRPTRKRR